MRQTKRLTMVITTTIATLMLAVPAANAFQSYAGTFADDDGSVHEANVEAILDDNITDGCNPPENDRYCPEDDVTRGQMAKFLVRAGNLAGSGTDSFTDDDDSPFERDINALAAADVTDGCNPPTNDRYCPTANVTRGQMAKFLVATFDYAPTNRDYFTDDNRSIFENDINAVRAAGVTLGCNPPANDEYCPGDTVTRAQMASFIARELNLSHPDPTPFGNRTCDPAYSPCVPTVEEVGDLNCPDIREQYPDGVRVDGRFSDSHGINGDGDGRACESTG